MVFWGRSVDGRPPYTYNLCKSVTLEFIWVREGGLEGVEKLPPPQPITANDPPEPTNQSTNLPMSTNQSMQRDSERAYVGNGLKTLSGDQNDNHRFNPNDGSNYLGERSKKIKRFFSEAPPSHCETREQMKWNYISNLIKEMEIYFRFYTFLFLKSACVPL